MIGVDGRVAAPRLECLARNHCRGESDVRGVTRAGPIDPAAPQQLRATLWSANDSRFDLACCFSDDAGGYLCNYVFFRALHVLSSVPRKRIGFVHVPPVEVMPVERQRAWLGNLLDTLSASSREAS